MKLINRFSIVLGLLALLTFSNCGDDDSGPTIKQQIGAGLEGAWTVSGTDQSNPDDFYDGMTVTFGAFTEGSGGSFSVSGIDADLISDFGTQYNIQGEPAGISLFQLFVGGNVELLTVDGDPTTGTINITFINNDGVTLGGRSTGLGEYSFTLSK